MFYPRCLGLILSARYSPSFVIVLNWSVMCTWIFRVPSFFSNGNSSTENLGKSRKYPVYSGVCCVSVWDAEIFIGWGDFHWHDWNVVSSGRMKREELFEEILPRLKSKASTTRKKDSQNKTTGGSGNEEESGEMAEDMWEQWISVMTFVCCFTRNVTS